MTAVYRLLHLRPQDCLCRGARLVTVRQPGSRVGRVIDCPQCTGRAELDQMVRRSPASVGGDVA